MSKTNPLELEVPVSGMDCADCARSVEQGIRNLPGVQSCRVLLSAERALVELDPANPAGYETIRGAIEAAGYRVAMQKDEGVAEEQGRGIAKRVFWLFGVVLGIVLLIVVAGEWFGVVESITDRVPRPVGLLLVLVLGYPVFRQVVLAALNKRIIAHTLMTVGAVAALVVGEWATAAVVVFFMRVGDYAEHFTTERARSSVRSLTHMAPRTARIKSGEEEHEVLVETVTAGDVVIVRPGETIPVDGEVIAGHATIDQAAITGESMPVDAAPGTRVFAATFARLGALRIRADAVGRETTFGRVIRMVEEAEANRGEVQRMADRFSGYYLPIVAVVAVVTFVFRQDVMATVAVLVVACSCAFALATPVAILASVGAAARHGLLIKGGKYLELLARADIVLLDKTGTLTLGQPRITDVVSLNGESEDELLALAASAERFSEHPLAEAVRRVARERGLSLCEPEFFETIPGGGIRAEIDGRKVTIGNARLSMNAAGSDIVRELQDAGKTVLFVDVNDNAAGVLAATDTERSDVPDALDALRRHGIRNIELLTGDNEKVAAALARRLKLRYRADLLPEDKTEIVRRYQAEGHTVVMIGDGVNDAPALAQADVGIAMGAAGTDVAIEAAHIALMKDDWSRIPDLFRIARRTMQVVKLNIGFTALYNLVGLTLAALGLLPPILAAAAQSLPDLGILANSARLIRQG